MRLLLRSVISFLGYVFHHNHDSKAIYYHDIGKKYTDMGTDLTLMQKHFDIVRNSGYAVVSEISLRQKEIMICFDDGWAGIYDYKDEFLKQKIFPTIFIAVDLIGKNGYLTKGQIKELQTLGFHFQAHTWSHHDLTTFDDEGLTHELRDSRKCLEETFGHPFDAICFPMGRFSEKVKNVSIKSGYRKLFTSLPGGYFNLEKENLICRNCAQNASPLEFKWMLNGLSLLFRQKLIRQHFVKD